MASDDRRNRIEIALATGLGVLALAVSGWSAYWQRAQARAQVWPRLQVNGDFERVEPAGGGLVMGRFKLKLSNAGTGPAVVHRISVSVDGKHAKDVAAGLDALGLPLSTLPLLSYDVDHDVIGAGSSVTLIDMPDTAQAMSFGEQRSRMQIAVCYCSVLDDCWIATDDGIVSVRRCDAE